MGLMGVAIRRSRAARMDSISYAIAMEISAGCAGTGVIASVNNSLYCDPILKYGTDAQKEELLVPFAKGERLGCFALTEPWALGRRRDAHGRGAPGDSTSSTARRTSSRMGRRRT
jgi:alkylation response protein AidB-like acyl-CoA dehydrogenase